ncbi:6753_t:CDS:1, partial [Gigaspora rosea]
TECGTVNYSVEEIEESVSENTEKQLKRKDSLVIEYKTINHGVRKMEDIIPAVKESNRDNPTKVVIEEKMNIDCQTIIEQKKKLEDIILVDKENNK